MHLFIYIVIFLLENIFFLDSLYLLPIPLLDQIQNKAFCYMILFCLIKKTYCSIM